MKKVIQTSGKRKSAVARATVKAGTGKVTINNKSLSTLKPELYQLRISEPLILAGDKAAKLDVEVNVFGGGMAGQADAARLAIGKALVEAYGNDMKQVLLDYDRTLLVADMRKNEPAKPNHMGKPRSKVQTSYR